MSYYPTKVLSMLFMPIGKRDTDIKLFVVFSNITFIGMLFGLMSLVSVAIMDNSILPYYARFVMGASCFVGVITIWGAVMTESRPEVQEKWTNFPDWRLSVKVSAFVIVNWLSTMVAWAYY